MCQGKAAGLHGAGGVQHACSGRRSCSGSESETDQRCTQLLLKPALLSAGSGDPRGVAVGPAQPWPGHGGAQLRGPKAAAHPRGAAHPRHALCLPRGRGRLVPKCHPVPGAGLSRRLKPRLHWQHNTRWAAGRQARKQMRGCTVQYVGGPCEMALQAGGSVVHEAPAALLHMPVSN